MAIKPSPTIAGKLRKLFSNNKQTIEPAIGDSIPGGGGGGNVLTLYSGEKYGLTWCYKDPECTDEYSSYQEAKDALENAGAINLISEGGKLFALCTTEDDYENIAWIYVGAEDGEGLDLHRAYLFSAYDPR